MILKYDEYDEETNMMLRCMPTELAVGANHLLVKLEGPTSTMVFGLGDNTEHQLSNMRNRKFTQPVWMKKIAPMNGLECDRIYAGGNKSAVLCDVVSSDLL